MRAEQRADTVQEAEIINLAETWAVLYPCGSVVATYSCENDANYYKRKIQELEPDEGPYYVAELDIKCKEVSLNE